MTALFPQQLWCRPSPSANLSFGKYCHNLVCGMSHMRFKNTFKPQGPQSQDGHTEDGAKPACLYLHSEIPPWIDDAHRFIRSGLSCGCRHASAWRIHGELGINISRSTSLKPSQHQRVLQVSE